MNLQTPWHIRYPLHNLCICGEDDSDTIDKIKELLKDSTGIVNKKDDTGNTPLHFAVKYNSLKVVKILLENGASLDIKNNDGDLPQTQPLHCMDPVYCCYPLGNPEICVNNQEILEFCRVFKND